MNQQTEPKPESAQVAQLENPTLETQGKTTNTMDKQEETKQDLLRITTGYGQHAGYTHQCVVPFYF
jgi:hypothetical protein